MKSMIITPIFISHGCIYSYKMKKNKNKKPRYIFMCDGKSKHDIELIFSRFQTLEDEHLVGKVAIFKPQIDKAKSSQTTSE